MFDLILNLLWQCYIFVVQEEVKLVLGCIELILLVLVVVVVVVELEGLVECVEVWVSLNLMKNGLGVIVFGMGMVGLLIVVVLGVLGGNVNVGLEVLKDVIVQVIVDVKVLLVVGKVFVKIQEFCDEIFFLCVKVWNGEKWVCVIIVGGYINIVYIEMYDGVVFIQQVCVVEGE